LNVTVAPTFVKSSVSVAVPACRATLKNNKT
jgi:hypothetical protein